jgi:glycosyltransferase involved in cell wall biosynthesis
MTIVIDCRMIDSGSGIGVYLRECLKWLLDSSHSFLLLGAGKKLEEVAGERKNASILTCTVKPFSIPELCFFSPGILKEINAADLYYSPYFNIPGGIKIPLYTTIHDVIFSDMPELTSKAGLAVRMWFYRRAFRHSEKIFTVSEFSKSRIEFHSRHKVQVIVTYSAIQSHLLKKKNLPVQKKGFILFIGNIKKNKGLPVLLDAFLAALDDGLEYKLVIVGSRDNFRSLDMEFFEKLDSLGLKAIEFTGFISDEALGKLLEEASLLVQPSLYEGFCLPPLEAMIAGTQALISDIPVLKEIYHDYPVIWFKSGDSEDLKNKLIELLHNKEPAVIKLSRELTERYTFKKTSSIILNELTAGQFENRDTPLLAY